jgi:group I intron endonuclease
MYLVYKHTSPSGKSYIGITNNYNRRCQEHQATASGCRAFKAAIKLYGWDNFIHEILAEGVALDVANKMEIDYIIEHQTLVPNGYNLKEGGDCGKLSDETKQKISELKKGLLKGRPITEETKQARMGRVPSAAARKSMSAAAKRRHRSEVSKIAKNYIVTSPSGEVYNITNLALFCREHNLRSSSMCDVAKGRYTHHRGWMCV